MVFNSNVMLGMQKVRESVTRDEVSGPLFYVIIDKDKNHYKLIHEDEHPNYEVKDTERSIASFYEDDLTELERVLNYLGFENVKWLELEED